MKKNKNQLSFTLRDVFLGLLMPVLIILSIYILEAFMSEEVRGGVKSKIIDVFVDEAHASPMPSQEDEFAGIDENGNYVNSKGEIIYKYEGHLEEKWYSKVVKKIYRIYLVAKCYLKSETNFDRFTCNSSFSYD